MGAKFPGGLAGQCLLHLLRARAPRLGAATRTLSRRPRLGQALPFVTSTGESRNELEQQRRRAHLSRMEAFEQEGRGGRQSGMEEPLVQHARQALTQVLKVVSPEAEQRSRERLAEVSKHHAPPS